MAVIYTDASFDQQLLYAGVGIYHSGKEFKHSFKYCAITDNNYAELIGIWLAVQYARKGDRVLSDSQHMVNLVKFYGVITHGQDVFNNLAKKIQGCGVPIEWIPRDLNKVANRIASNTLTEMRESRGAKAILF